MTDNAGALQAASKTWRAVLTPHRSLSPRGFLILMSALSVVSFVTGVAFYLVGAWPVLGFFGFDVLLVYLAFKLNYRAGRAYETIELLPETLTVTRFEPNGRRRQFAFNPYWAQVRLREWPDGRTILSLASHGREVRFGGFLTDDERREVASALRAALAASRGGK